MSTRIRKVFWKEERGRCVRLTTLPPFVCRLSRQCGILNISQLYRPLRPVKETALLFLYHIIPPDSDFLIPNSFKRDRLCGLVVRVPGYRSWGPAFDSLRSQIFWEVVGLERGPLSLVSTTEELLGRNSSGSGLGSREYGRGDPLRWPRDAFHLQKLALASPTSGGRSVCIVLSRTMTTEL
jgi:hypothetical protein